MNYFPAVIDSSMRKTFSICLHKGYLSYIRHLHGTTANYDLIFGGAYAAGNAAFRLSYWDTGTISDPHEIKLSRAMCAAWKAAILEWHPAHTNVNEAKSIYNLLSALYAYFSHPTAFPAQHETMPPITIDNQGTLAVEVSFCIPLDISHPDTGEPMQYAGRLDYIGHEKGLLWPVDDKTTKRLSTNWHLGWETNTQIPGYIWGIGSLGFDPYGLKIRGTQIQKTQFNWTEKPVLRGDWDVLRWYDQLHKDIERWINAYKTGYWDYALDTACTMYNRPCPYFNACTIRNEEQMLQSPNYIQKVWSPLGIREVARIEKALLQEK